MAKVKLNDVAIEARETWKQNKTDVPVVGLEHLEPDEIWLRRWDLNPDENTFTKGFRKGQLLFGRRRAYQKKMSVASCDGICSGDITVIAARPEKILPELLPFYLRTDSFFDFAVRGSGGSLSPRVKWSHISDYEFDLPPMDEQKKLAELLWAANDLKEKYKKAITATDEMLKAKFREMFGEVGNEDGFNAEAQRRREGESGLAANAEVAKSKWPMVRLADLAKEISAGKDVPREYKKSRDEDYQIPIYSNSVDKKGLYGFAKEARIFEPSLTITARGTIGYVCARYKPFVPIIRLIVFTPKVDVLDLRYAEYSLQGRCAANGVTSIPQLTVPAFKEYKIPLPPLSLQREFVAIAEKAEAAKTALKKSIADIDQVMKGLING